MFGVLLTIFFW
jgi:hypothetical protein